MKAILSTQILFCVFSAKYITWATYFDWSWPSSGLYHHKSWKCSVSFIVLNIWDISFTCDMEHLAVVISYGYFTPGENTTGTHWIGGWLGFCSLITDDSVWCCSLSRIIIIACSSCLTAQGSAVKPWFSTKSLPHPHTVPPTISIHVCEQIFALYSVLIDYKLLCVHSDLWCCIGVWL